MNEPIVGTYVIGQTPRPDLTGELTGRFSSVRFEILGALDGLERADIPPCPARGYPLETKLRDGSRVVVDAAFVGTHHAVRFVLLGTYVPLFVRKLPRRGG